MTCPSFFINASATTEIYTLSLHDALPICRCVDGYLYAASSGQLDESELSRLSRAEAVTRLQARGIKAAPVRSEEHTSELQSHVNLVCRLLLEKKKVKTFQE